MSGSRAQLAVLARDALYNYNRIQLISSKGGRLTAFRATTIDPSRAAAILGEHPATRVVDVRTPPEHRTQHIRDSHNIPLDILDEFTADIAGLNAPVLLVCQSGQRAGEAAAMLHGAGVSELFVLEGGIAAWTASSQPIARGEPKVSLERQVRMVAGAFAAAGGVLALAVNPWFALIPSVVGTGLLYAGASNTCMMATVLARFPYNRGEIDQVGTRRRLQREVGAA